MASKKNTANAHNSLIDIQTLAGHPAWAMLSWETKGMALALMAMPLEDEYQGTLPPETEAWRNVLGIPSSRAMAQAREHSLGLKGSRALQEMDQAWAFWLGEMKSWFKLIDRAFLNKYPKWAAMEGRWWHPMLEHCHATISRETGVLPVKTDKKANATATTTQKRVEKKTSVKNVDKDIISDLDYPPIRLTSGVVRHQWDTPMQSEMRIQLWDTGIAALGGSEKSARSLIGRLIKEYGEAAVAEAVAKLAVRASRPADPAAFLRKQVAAQVGDAPGAKAARLARTSVAL